MPSGCRTTAPTATSSPRRRGHRATPRRRACRGGRGSPGRPRRAARRPRRCRHLLDRDGPGESRVERIQCQCAPRSAATRQAPPRRRRASTVTRAGGSTPAATARAAAEPGAGPEAVTASGGARPPSAGARARRPRRRPATHPRDPARVELVPDERRWSQLLDRPRHASPHLRHRHDGGHGRGPWSSASRPPATRPASGSCAAARCWPTRSRAASTSTPASAASSPRWPAGPTSRRWCRPSSGPARPRASGCTTSTRSRSPAVPGLAGALLVGVAAAKALALGLGKPLYGVNHLAAHVAVDQLEHGPLPEPCLAMLVSGGHSSLLRVERRHRRRRPAGIDDRRRRRRGVRQGRPAARPAVPRRPAHRPGRPRRRQRRDRLPARPDAATRPRAAPLRLLVLRAQDRGRALGRGPRALRRAGAGRRRGGPSRRRSATC